MTMGPNCADGLGPHFYTLEMRSKKKNSQDSDHTDIHENAWTKQTSSQKSEVVQFYPARNHWTCHSWNLYPFYKQRNFLVA